MIVKIAAGISLAISIIAILAGPTLIGKQRGEFTYSSYLIAFFQAILMFILSRHAFGWW